MQFLSSAVLILCILTYGVSSEKSTSIIFFTVSSYSIFPLIMSMLLISVVYDTCLFILSINIDNNIAAYFLTLSVYLFVVSLFILYNTLIVSVVSPIFDNNVTISSSFIS